MSDDTTLPRRVFLGAGISELAAASVSAGADASTKSIKFRLKETAGLRRFGYPVSVVLPPELTGPNLRLERDGKAVASQFRVVKGLDGNERVVLDFNSSPGPLESESYVIHGGDEVQRGPEPSKGMSVVKEGNVFRVSNGSALSYLVPQNLDKLVRSVVNSGTEYIGDLRTTSGLELYQNVATPFAQTFGRNDQSQGVISRQGPIAVGLRFDNVVTLSGGKVIKSTVDMTFPNSKSWFEATWTIDDPDGLVAILTFELSLAIGGPTAYVDFGMNHTVYGQINGNERMFMGAGRAPIRPQGDANRPWFVGKGPDNAMQPFAEATSPNSRAEGWAHVMDRDRCTAIAVADFGRKTHDGLFVNASGKVQFSREFVGVGVGAARDGFKGTKVLHFWSHFVPTPVQVGAATSPQAMLAPLEVEWV